MDASAPASHRLQESNQQFHKAWSVFARANPNGEVREESGVLIAAANVAWLFGNSASLASPVHTISDLKTRVAFASEYFERSSRAWFFPLCEDWVAPDLRPQVPALFEARSLRHAMDLRGMVAERLRPPLRMLPKLDVRRAETEETWNVLADINALSYGAPLAYGREILCVKGFWEPPLVGYVGYANGQAVTTTVAIPIDRAIYIAWVATHPDHRRKSYAEVIMRHALGEAHTKHDIERSVLHATPAGFPVYERMGYEVVTKFPVYAPEH